MTEPRGGAVDTGADDRVAALRERVYVTFSLLGVLLALHADADHLAVGEAALVVVVSVLGTVLAATAAEVVASVVVHHALPHRGEAAHLALVGAGALTVALVPLALVGAAGLGLLALPVALALGAGVLALTLVLIGALAVRRLGLTRGQRLVAIAVEAAVAAAVIALELLIH